jgi:hypothetical protein
MKTVLSVVSGALLYATVRYNVFKGVPWTEWPTFVVNKAAALGALLLVVLHLLRRRTRGAGTQGHLVSAAAWLAALHVGLSLAILSPASFPKLFVEGKPTTAAAWSILLGALAAAGAFAGSRRPDAWSDRAGSLRLGLLAFVPGLHAALLGYEGWFAPSTWPGYLVPITLIAFVSGTIGVLAAGWPSRGNR